MLPNVPVHITQRGVNRCAIFVDDEDREHLRQLLVAATKEEDVAVHAYVLMGNHVHVLATAPAPGALSRAMRHAGHCYVQSFNRRHRRTGTLWEGRFKSCLVDSERYLLEVYRYIELNPVRAGMVDDPERYRWSSVHANLGKRADPLITPHPSFLAVARTQEERQVAYRQHLRDGVKEEDLTAIRAHLHQERALGDWRFQAMVAKALNRPVECRPIGRPRTTDRGD